MVDEIDAMLRSRHEGTLSDDEIKDWIGRGMTGWSSPLALQGAHLLNDSRLLQDNGVGVRFDRALAWWERERALYTADPSG